MRQVPTEVWIRLSKLARSNAKGFRKFALVVKAKPIEIVLDLT